MGLMPSSISERRVKAAELSGGTSSDLIYSRVERVIAEKKLTGRILDYGAGVGLMTRRLLASGRFERIAGADIRAVPADLDGSVQWIEQDLNTPLAGQEEAYDSIVAVETIEHLENPRLMMREIWRMLSPGGTVIVTTPNNESFRSLMALFVRGHFVAFSDSCYPAHITALLRKDLARIFRETGFSEPEFYFTDNGGIPGKPSIAWQQVSFGLLGGLRFSDNVVAVARKPGESR